MTASLRTHTTGSGTVAVPGGVADGDFMVGLVIGGGPLTLPTGWTQIVANAGQFLDAAHILCYRVASSEPSSYSFSGGIFVYDHVDVAGGPIDGTPSTALNTTTAPALTITNADSMVVRVYVWNNLGGGKATACAGYTIVDSSLLDPSNNNHGTYAEALATSSGAQGTPAWSPAWASGNGIATSSSFALVGLPSGSWKSCVVVRRHR